MDEHLHHVLALEELNVGRPPNEAVQIGLLDPEVNINSVEHVLRQLVQYVLGHLDVNAPVLVRLQLRLVRYLDPSRVERGVHVLVGAHEDHVFEPLQAFLLRQLEEVAAFEGARLVVIGHP